MSDESNYFIFLMVVFTEDAKRMAIKEEQHDPGYEESSSSATQQMCSFDPANEQGDHHHLMSVYSLRQHVSQWC